MNKRVIVDMDGVISDIYSQFLKYELDDLNIQQSLQDVTGKMEYEAFANCEKYLHSPDFFYDAPPIENSIDVLEEINRKYDLFIVSAAVEYPLSLHEKVRWLDKHFPFIKWQQIVLCGSKQPISGDVMIDDHFKNLDFFGGETLLYSQPHNLERSEGRHKRVNSWEEIGGMLL